MEMTRVYRMPDTSLSLNLTFETLFPLPSSQSFLALSSHMALLVSFWPIVMGSICDQESCSEEIEADFVVPKPVMFFGKHISLQNSFEKWEGSLTTSTTEIDYQE